jgi:hypothetical protein
MRRVESRSDAQAVAEDAARAAFSTLLGVPLTAAPYERMRFDGLFDDGERVVLIEISAQLGQQRGAQAKKICTDVLKLNFARSLMQAERPTARIETYVVFIDESAKRMLDPGNGNWAARAAKHYGVVPRFVEIDAAVIEDVRRAKPGQDLRSAGSVRES